jgi:hypothetical protein
MTRTEAPLDPDRLAKVLARLGADTERLGERLCADPALVAAHLASLQEIDRIAQWQRALAKALQASCNADAIASIGLCDLADLLAD